MHPRRLSWLPRSNTATGWAKLDPPFRVIETRRCRPGSAQEPRTRSWRSHRAARCSSTGPRSSLDQESPAGSFAVQFVGWQYAALVSPQPKSVGTVSGTGLIAPAGF